MSSIKGDKYMDMEKISVLEQLLNCPDSAPYHDMIERISRAQKYLILIMQEMPTYSLKEKAIVINLLSRANELVRRCMEHEVKSMGMSPEKLQAIAESAKNSDNPAAKQMVASFMQMQHQFEQLQASISKADTVLSAGARLPDTMKKKMERKLPRKDWQKP
jgi:acyl-CoA synthetase (AMP-forming)/AMP-acid ligase II